MPDDNSKNQDDHWRRLAEELGLPFDEPAPAPVREPSPPPEPVAAGAPVATPADFLENEEEPALPSPAAAWPAPVLDTGEAEAKNRVRLEPVAPPEAGDDEGKPRRGRRRRGRGRGERRPAADEAAAVRPESPDAPASDIAAELTDDDVPPADAAEEVGEAGAGDPQGPRKRRRRRRRRKPDEAGIPAGPGLETPRIAVKPAPIQAAAEEFEEEEDDENDVEDTGDYGQPQGGMDADDDEPEEDFSDWNVPSWNDLIAALYRPDR